jgi:DNA polymerase/3'-5' exonuclease PolX
VVWFLAKKITKELGIQRYTLGGSYRRGKWWCNDIDIVVPVQSAEEAAGYKARLTQLDWTQRANFFNEEPFGYLVSKKIGSRVICLDLFCVLPGCMGNALLFTTGSREFNDNIRSHIYTLGYSWSHPPYFEHIATCQKICFSSERAALKFLGLPWVKPRNRL